ncbi:MAG: trimethylamine methyltransferase family protein [Bacillota bacterium]|nr:trimethylamine methyltransferase family protein [Bacillota bacterium]
MKFSDFKVLSQQEINQVHEASVDTLENSGVLVYSSKVLDLLKDNGASVDYAARLVKIPRKLVDTCLKTIPKTFDLYNREGRKAFTIGDGITKCASGHNAIFMIDAQTSERRNSTVNDVEDFGVISENLEDIDIVGVPVMPQDVTPEASLIYAVKALYENTSKPLFFSTESSKVNAAIIKIMKTIAGKDDLSGCPSAICQLSSTSPLLWEQGAVDALYDIAKEGIPLVLLPEPMSGVSAPNTVAGLLTMHNTEILSGVVISQLVRSETPVIYGSSWTTYDMKYANAMIGGPETSLLRVAGCQMAKHYRMPSHTTAPNSDANTHDEQNAWEKTISNMCSICAGNDISMNSGMFATGLTISLEQLVLDDELNGIIRRLSRGIDVNANTIGVEVIKSVGPRGIFIMEDHTLEFLRSDEFRETKVSNMKNYQNWLNDGAPTVVQNAAKKVKELLKTRNEKPFDLGKIKVMEDIIKEFEKNIGR